jgi:hypothetical protein
VPAIYSSQYALGDSAIGPSGENYEPIQNLNPLAVTDDFLYFGGTASITLFLGNAFTDGIDSFSLYVRVIEATSGDVVTEVDYGGANGLASMIALSAVYQIKPQTQPSFVAQWKVLGTPGVVISGPSSFSFCAIIFENEG